MLGEKHEHDNIKYICQLTHFRSHFCRKFKFVGISEEIWFKNSPIFIHKCISPLHKSTIAALLNKSLLETLTPSNILADSLDVLQNIGNSVYPILYLLEETLKAVGSFCLVSMPGEVKEPIPTMCNQSWTPPLLN